MVDGQGTVEVVTSGRRVLVPIDVLRPRHLEMHAYVGLLYVLVKPQKRNRESYTSAVSSPWMGALLEQREVARYGLGVLRSWHHSGDDPVRDVAEVQPQGLGTGHVDVHGPVFDRVARRARLT